MWRYAVDSMLVTPFPISMQKEVIRSLDTAAAVISLITYYASISLFDWVENQLPNDYFKHFSSIIKSAQNKG